MKNYKMSDLRKRNDNIKIIKKIILFTVIFWGIVLLFKHWDNQESKLMETNYCWDSDGNHYVAPDPRCNN